MAPDDCEKTMTVVEPSFFDYTAWAFDHRDELREALREAGASEYLIRFIDTVEQNTRHSVLMTLFRHHGSSETGPEEAHAPNTEDCQEAYRLGGGFMTKLWDGHVADAYCNADDNNRPMMETAFGKEEIISTGLSNDGPFSEPDYLRRLISERWDGGEKCSSCAGDRCYAIGTDGTSVKFECQDCENEFWVYQY